MKNKIFELQQLMHHHKIDAYVMPSHDEFYSEIVPKQNARLEYISNFSGSNGIAVITKGKKHFLFTDGRYLTQASIEINDCFEIIDMTTTNFKEWLKEYSKEYTVGFNSKLHNISFLDSLLKQTKNIKSIEENLVDEIWKSRPQPIEHKIFEHSIKYAGKSVENKISSFRKELKKQKAEYFIINTPESICWLLNIRGNYIKTTPIIFAYLIITETKLWLFSDAKIDNKLKQYFAKNNLDYYNISKLEQFLNSLKKQKNIYTTVRTPFWLKNKIPNIKIIQDPSELSRACKNKTEISNAIIAHNKDSKALTACLRWIKKVLRNNELYEADVVDKLLYYRKQNKTFIYPSFDSIVGFKENGAIIHYKPNKNTSKKITGNGLLLIDSGGQYLEGTTDITRTISIGTPTKEEIHNFTLVLKGHIKLATAIFPEGTTGSQLDILARSPLWNDGKDYAHGTGHGVGSFLSVHEGPQAIRKGNHTTLQEGMILSIEPGFYKTKKYGIRIENLAYIKKSTRFKGYLEFELLTKVPIETNLVDFTLLDSNEKDWLEKYNNACNNLKIE